MDEQEMNEYSNFDSEIQSDIDTSFITYEKNDNKDSFHGSDEVVVPINSESMDNDDTSLPDYEKNWNDDSISEMIRKEWRSQFLNSSSNSFQENEIIDYVLVYEYNDNEIHAQKRELFESSLIDQGLELINEEQNEQFGFVKVHAPEDVLYRYCDIMKLRMPINVSPDKEFNESNYYQDTKSWFMKLIFLPFDPQLYFNNKYSLATEFSREKDYLFNTKDKNFFTPKTRIIIVNFILERQREGIQRLLDEKVYTAAYPLHDGTIKEDRSTRALLMHECRLGKFLMPLPLETIEEYFGENFALYFAWRNFYSYMLIPATLAGVLYHVYGLFYPSTYKRKECSDWAYSVIMCPQCDTTCDYTRLSESCVQSLVATFFDNDGLTLLVVFMAIWSAFYLKLWKRKTAELTYHWGLADWDYKDDVPRFGYITALSKSFVSKITKPEEKVNIITRQKEPHVNYWKVRLPATIFSFSIVFLLIAVVIASVIGIILYKMSRIASRSLLGKDGQNTSQESLLLSGSGAFLNLVSIMLLNLIYDWLAVHLTEMELRRTQTEFDDSLNLKIYLFHFINNYSSIFYMIFLKGKFIGYPKEYNRIFGYRQEECSINGCLLDINIQLLTIIVGKQIIHITSKLLTLTVKKYYNQVMNCMKRKKQNTIENKSQWWLDFELLDLGTRGLHDDYLNTIVQYGFVVLFIAAFPLAPLFAFLFNTLEARLDARNFLSHYRRPVPHRVRNIGIWARIQDTITRLSIVTNAFIIAFNSNFIPQLVHSMVVHSDDLKQSFLNSSLAIFNTSDFANGTAPHNSSFKNISTCHYVDYRNPPDHPTAPYGRSLFYWQVLVGRLIFVVVFQAIVDLVTMVADWCLYKIPHKLKEQMKREAYLTEELIIRRETEHVRAQSPESYTFNRGGFHRRVPIE